MDQHVIGDLFTVDPFLLWRPRGEIMWSDDGTLLYRDVAHNCGSPSAAIVVTVIDTITTKWNLNQLSSRFRYNAYEHLLVLTEDGEVWMLPTLNDS
jgi:hypothetical protein